MILVLVPLLLILSAVAALARQPRFLGPPEKKPADAGMTDAGEPADAGERR